MTQQALRELVAKWRRELREVDSDRDNYSPPSADYFASELESLLGEQREALGETLEHIHITDKQAVITGDPNDYGENDSRAHNCDQMGCPTLDHVLYRLPFTDHRKPVDFKALAKELAESIDFTAGPVQAREAFKKKLAAMPFPHSPRSPVEAVPVAKIRELEKEFRETAETLTGTASAAGVLACADRLSAIVKENSK